MSVVIGTADAPPRVVAPTVGNDSVSRAFAIGWQMTDLFLTGQTVAAPAADPDALPSIATLDARQQTALGIAEILASVELIDPNGKYTRDVETAWKAVEQAFDDARDQAAFQASVLELHVELLTALSAEDFRLAKAYGIGRALGDCCIRPPAFGGLKERFCDGRLNEVEEWLMDLASAFPPHAARAVGLTLGAWKAFLADPATAADSHDDIPERLYRQAKIWRALLSNEKCATDMLQVEHYLKAADEVFKDMRKVLLSFLRHHLGVVIGMAVIVAVAIVAAYAAARVPAAIAAIAVVAGATGLSWQGMRHSVAELAQQLKEPLWGRELDWAVARAIVTVPGKPDFDAAVPRSGPVKTRFTQLGAR